MVYVCVFVHWCYGWNIFMVYDYEPPAYCRQMIPQGVEHGSISTHGNIKQNIWTLIDEYEKVSPGKKQRKPGSRCLSRLGATSFHYSAARTLVKLRFVALEISSTSQKACWICSFKTPLFNLPPFCGWNSMHQSHPMNWGWTWTLQQALRCNPWSCSIRCWHLRQIKKAPFFTGLRVSWSIPSIWDVILPIDELHHFSWLKPPTRLILTSIYNILTI